MWRGQRTQERFAFAGRRFLLSLQAAVRKGEHSKGKSAHQVSQISHGGNGMPSNGISTKRERPTTKRDRHVTGHAKLVITLGLTMAMIATVASSTAVAGPTWLGAESLSGTQNETVHSPQNGLDVVGNTTVAWWATKRSTIGVERRIKYTDRPIGGEWSAPEYLPVGSEEIGEYARDLQLAVDAEGNAVSVWRDRVGDYWKSVETHRDAGGEWSRFAELGEGHKTGIPRITVAGGNAVATWTRLNFSSY